MAGGSGKRLWPLSRESKPKQLLKLFMEKSFLERAVLLLFPVVDSIAISTGKNLENEIKKIFPKTKLIIEPERRDTAAAIGFCAIQFAPEDVLVFIPSDAYINPDKEFQDTIRKAISIAENESGIVAVGVKPTNATTRLGYVEVGDGNKLMKFHEKPTEDVAKEYVKRGFLWNLSIWVCKAGVLLEEYRKHEPGIYSDLMKIKAGGNLELIYPKIKKISVDYAIMEKSDKMFCVSAGFEWNDIGGFNAIMEVVKEKNVIMNGKLIEAESGGNVLSTDSNEKTIALIDCNDLVVIDTKDALMVCPRNSIEKLKKFVEEKVPKELQ